MANIREAKIKDAEEIREVAAKTWKITYEEFIEEETIQTVVDKWYKITDLRQQVEDPYFYVAVEDKTVVGFIHATLDEASGELSLHRLYLDPDYWRKGIGTELWERVLKELSSGVEKASLEVLENNDVGKRFYVEKGFEEVEREEVKLFGEPVVQLVMEREIK